MRDPSLSDAPQAGELVRLHFDEQGLIPVIAQDATTRETLLLAYMSVEALEATLASGDLTLWSRSRWRLWRKGETSGHVLRVRELRVNCEANSLLARVEPLGPGACHEGYRGCYYRALSGATVGSLTARSVEPQTFDPVATYPDSPEVRGRERAKANRRGEAPNDAAGVADAALERDTRALYAAYERLRDGLAPSGSRTAALLREPDVAFVRQRALARARQELEELRGAVAETHQHYGDERDVILEASQVGYWAMVAAVAQRLPYDAWSPHSVWLAGWYGRRGAEGLGEEAPSDLQAVVFTAGAQCRIAGIHPAVVIAADLAELRGKYGTGVDPV